MYLRTIFMLVAVLSCLNLSAAQTPSPALLVLEKSDRRLAIVNPESLNVVQRVPAGEDPHEVVVSDDGRFAYISNYGAFSNPQHTISVVDLSSQKALPAIDLGAFTSPHGLDFAEGKLYFTAEGSKSIGRYDPSSQRIDWILGIGQNRTHMLLVSKDRSQIFTSDVNSGAITIIDRDKSADVSGWSETHIAVGKGPEGFDVSPDGKELWAANADDGTVSVIEIGRKKVVDTFKVPIKFSNRLKFSPDGRMVLISDLKGEDLAVVDAKTRRVVKTINLAHGAAGILMVPDGSRAFVAVSGGDYVAVIDLRNLTVSGRISTGKGPDGLAWATRK